MTDDNRSWTERIESDIAPPAGSKWVETLLDLFVTTKTGEIDTNNSFQGSKIGSLLYNYENLYAHTPAQARDDMQIPVSLYELMERYQEQLVAYRSNSGKNEEFISKDDIEEATLSTTYILYDLKENLKERLEEMHSVGTGSLKSQHFIENLSESIQTLEAMQVIMGNLQGALVDMEEEIDNSKFSRGGAINAINEAYKYYDPSHLPPLKGNAEETPGSLAEIIEDNYLAFFTEHGGDLSKGITDYETFSMALREIGMITASLSDWIGVGGNRLVQETQTPAETAVSNAFEKSKPLNLNRYLDNHNKDINRALGTLETALEKWREVDAPPEQIDEITETLLEKISDMSSAIDSLVHERSKGPRSI